MPDRSPAMLGQPLSGRFGRANGSPTRARLAAGVRLSKAEAFDACQTLADADRCLRLGGHPAEASALADLFVLIESRLCDAAGAGDDPLYGDGAVGDEADDAPSSALARAPASAPDLSGWYSSESEFTQ